MYFFYYKSLQTNQAWGITFVNKTHSWSSKTNFISHTKSKKNTQQTRNLQIWQHKTVQPVINHLIYSITVSSIHYPKPDKKVEKPSNLTAQKSATSYQSSVLLNHSLVSQWKKHKVGLQKVAGNGRLGLGKKHACVPWQEGRDPAPWQ